MSTWVEVWIDSPSREYLLLVRGQRNGPVEIVDPQEGWRVIETFADYSSAAHWLNEDEYDLVEGRLEPRGNVPRP
jgi:antibiotic biosynthesis monooxygenase (ABM) superfamily enzyme